MGNWAFLIGISKYDHQDQFNSYEFCDRHIMEFAKVLEDSGEYKKEAIRILTTATNTGDPVRNNIIIEFSRLLNELDYEDTLIVYFVGHGGSYRGSNYIFPKDAFIDENDPTILMNTSISLNSLIGQLELRQSQAMNVFFITDACREIMSGAPIPSLSVETSQDVSTDVFEFDAGQIDDYPSGISFIFSCSPKQLAYSFVNEDIQHSIFSYALLEGLTDERKISFPVTYGKLVKYLLKRVPIISRKEYPKQSVQIPHDKSSIRSFKKPLLGISLTNEKTSPTNIGKINMLSENLKKKFKDFGIDDHSIEKLEPIVQSNRKEELEQAIDSFEIKILDNLTELESTLLISMGIAYRELDEYEQAAWYFKATIDTEPSALAYTHLGYNSIQMRSVKEAENAFFDAIDQDRKYFLPWLHLGMLFINQKRYVEAEEALRKTIDLNPDHANVYYNLGLVYLNQQKQKAAKKAFVRVLTLEATHAPAYYHLGILYLQEQNEKEAEKALKQCIELDGTYVLAYYHLGLLFVNQNNYADAVNALVSMIELDPAHAMARHHLGLIYAKQKLSGKAQKELERSIKLNENFAPSWYHLGVLLANKRRPNEKLDVFEERLSKSEQTLRKSIDLDPNNAQTSYQLGVLLFDQKRYNEAEQAFMMTIKLDPSAVDAWYRLGLLSIKLGAIEKAENAFRTAINHDKEHAQSWYQLGVLLFDKSKYDDAEKSFHNAVKYNKSDADTWNYIGDILLYYRMNDKKARDAYHKAIKYKATHAVAWYNLGNALRTKPNFIKKILPSSRISANRKNIESESAYRKAIEIDPTFALAWINLGVLYYQAKRYVEAETAYLEALKHDSDSLETLYNLGTLYEVRGKFKDAKMYYKKVLEIATEDWELRKITEKKLQNVKKS